MRLSTITNWAYGGTVGLTIIAGTTMLLASSAQEREREAVARRYSLDQATERLDVDVLALSDLARQYLNRGDATYALQYRHELAKLGSVQARLARIRDAGAMPHEVSLLHEAIKTADELRDEQHDALALHARGREQQAREILFGAPYERDLERASDLVNRFQEQLDQRTQAEVAEATDLARLWRRTSEGVLALTGLLFLCVLYFIFKRRVLRPVVRLSDVVNRLAAQDFAVETPTFGDIDEIGDMALAIQVFRENGLERQKLETERDADCAVRNLLSRMTQRMQGCDTLMDLREVVRRFVPEIAPELAGRLYLVDQARNAVVEACNWLNPSGSMPEFSPLSCWALRRGLLHRPRGAQIDIPCEHIAHDHPDAPIADTLCLPLTAHRATLGLLYFEPREHATHVTPQVYLAMLAENVSLALANLRLRETLREMAMADPLTGLANRRQLDAVLGAQIAEAKRTGGQISCLMLDIDHFKRFNDAFGHEAGDMVLREVSAILKHATREEGTAFRYGGEELLLLLPGFAAERAAERAEEIRARIAALELTHRNGDLGPITVSIGVATAPEQTTFERLLESADAAVYRAKALGRDQVITVAVRRDGQAA
jgi:diguanylate cyclase (GGDEF)-like protein